MPMTVLGSSLPRMRAPPALQVVGQRAAADLAELVLLFQPRDLDDRAFFICRHSYAPLSYTVSMKVFSMRLNSTTPKTSAAAVKIRLYTMPNVVTVPSAQGSHAGKSQSATSWG